MQDQQRRGDRADALKAGPLRAEQPRQCRAAVELGGHVGNRGEGRFQHEGDGGHRARQRNRDRRAEAFAVIDDRASPRERGQVFGQQGGVGDQGGLGGLSGRARRAAIAGSDHAVTARGEGGEAPGSHRKVARIAVKIQHHRLAVFGGRGPDDEVFAIRGGERGRGQPGGRRSIGRGERVEQRALHHAGGDKERQPDKRNRREAAQHQRATS